MFKTIHKAVHGLAWIMAVIGGASLAAMILMICLSILGREASDLLHSTWMQTNMPGVAQSLMDAGVGPIYGDYELVTGAMAFIVFCFLGWCQITAGHATVDVFTSGLSQKSLRWLQFFIELLFAAALILVAIQLYDGMNTLIRRRSTTFLLQYPLWWNYAAALVPAIATAVIAAYMVIVRFAEALQQKTLVASAGADH